jgi:hypothetical protein
VRGPFGKGKKFAGVLLMKEIQRIASICVCVCVCQLQNVVEELFQASGFDVEDSTLYKLWVCDDLQKLYP